jgi:hypothetical protein
MRVFGIGLSKTGTTSLYAALHMLGLRAATYGHMREHGLGPWFRGDFGPDCLAGFDAATDLPLGTWFAELDRRFPGARFVLTVRDLEGWLASSERHYAREPATPFGRDVRLATFGMTGFHEERFRAVHERHEREVRAHFAGRPESLLVLDVIGGEGWERLCPFLGVPVPGAPFPHVQPGWRPAGERAVQGLAFAPAASG